MLLRRNLKYSWMNPTSNAPGRFNQTENPRGWDRGGESERESEYGNTTVVLPYVGHQMLNFILI